LGKRKISMRAPVPDDLPPDLPEDERRPARMRLVASRRLCGLTVVLDGLHDPHNISAVLRSCEGFGIQQVHLLAWPSAAGEPSDHARLREVAHLHHYRDARAVAAALHESGSNLAALPDRKAFTLEEMDFSRKIALVFARTDASPTRWSPNATAVQVPMPGFSQS